MHIMMNFRYLNHPKSFRKITSLFRRYHTCTLILAELAIGMHTYVHWGLYIITHQEMQFCKCHCLSTLLFVSLAILVHRFCSIKHIIIAHT